MLYLCCLTARTSDPASGELGLEDGLLIFSGMAVTGVKASNCLENRLFAEVAGIVLVAEFKGFGEPVEDGV